MSKAYWINTFTAIPVWWLCRTQNDSRPNTEFASVGAAVAAYHSAAYQEALSVLGDGAERDIRIIEAVE